MALVDFIAVNGHWSWIVAGLVLLALELFLPGGILLWMGIAGIATGLLTMLQPLAWPLQWLIFGVLSLAGIAIWLRIARNRPARTDRPFLNQRADSFIGQDVVLEQAIVQGYGRVAMGDTVWRVAGPDLPVGQRVRIVGSQGAVLLVEPLP
ncbi:NfeD family protein [Devosia aquimaris]|uniref:NfeD family protein n=1 Tax=Devosia aquimaris TaxID=2866214 RepID=UPI001CD08AF2|nr:NfeD family protein [Devosia sp. CJK-A8-3]